MKKSQAMELFGGAVKTGDALGISRAAVYAWPDELPQWQIDRVVGAALRLGIDIFHLDLQHGGVPVEPSHPPAAASHPGEATVSASLTHSQ